eukprot:maker-scaffold532_size145644-snap-gene-0.28 protein:Tk04518 transcript:maker-scaffold532_size145644-snap-gene-0.28-mRNA-1 annotation:"hypothetical protein CAPTEDRAFT_163453"
MSKDPEKAMEVVDDDHEDIEDEEEDEAGNDGQVAAALLKNPAVMAALQGKLNSMVGTPSGYIESLPAPVKRRLKSLKKLQFANTEIEAKFYEEIHELECKYHKLYTPLYEKRSQITQGLYEPNEEECDWPSEDEEDDEELSEEMKAKAKLETDKKSNGSSEKEVDVRGVPEFWLTIFKNVDMLQEMVQDHDEAALTALQDIKVKFAEKPMGFTLYFHFATNDYFTDSILTKEYFMKCEPSEDDPFSFEGPEIVKCQGCPVNWKPGKNLTVKTVKTKQKHKSKGSVRTITKTVKNDSFFNFFDPPPCEENEEDMDPMTQDLLTADFEIGHYIRERIIPRAVLFFTGEALEDDFDEDEEEESGDEDGEEGEEDEDDPDFKPKKGGKGQEQQECKQQ